mmetsp:Transcript_1296/g.2813  ORF Transcript_1296/g.2813 Transcript_1296/m.2813 type:complete len:309 (-) Transcript_1296:85-1011(-)
MDKRNVNRSRPVPHLCKTTLCRMHARGRCRYGLECLFAHSLEELKRAPDLTKTRLCQAWTQGSCHKDAAECSFAHGREELRLANAGLCTPTAAKIAARLSELSQSAPKKSASEILKLDESPRLEPASLEWRSLTVLEAKSASTSPTVCIPKARTCLEPEEDWTPCAGTASTMTSSDFFRLTSASAPSLQESEGSIGHDIDSDGEIESTQFYSAHSQTASSTSGASTAMSLPDDLRQMFTNFLGQLQPQAGAEGKADPQDAPGHEEALQCSRRQRQRQRRREHKQQQQQQEGRAARQARQEGKGREQLQ